MHCLDRSICCLLRCFDTGPCCLFCSLDRFPRSLTPIMPPTNTPQINFNIITFSFSIFRGFQGFSLTSCRRTDKQETCMAIQRRCLLVLCILLLLSHGSGHQKIYLPKRQMLFYSFSSQIPQASHKYSHFVHRTFSSVAIYILHWPDNTFDNFHTAPYSLLLTLSQQ